jgi:protein-tyrosine-phosphatase
VATVLFVCKANQGRSVMSQALLEHAAGDRHHAISAGSEAVPGRKQLRVDWDLADPQDADIDTTRAIRDAITRRVEHLVDALDRLETMPTLDRAGA